MFFQAINRMITAGTDLSFSIRQVDNRLTVAVMPRRTGLKGEAGGANRSPGIEWHSGGTGRRVPSSHQHSRTESAGHPHQPGDIRKTGGTGGVAEQGRQIPAGKGTEGGQGKTGENGKIAEKGG